MNKLIIMVGLQGSGKSTVAKNLLDENTFIVSSDEIRTTNPELTNEQVFNKLYAEVKSLLRNKNNVIIDATNITIKSRGKMFESIFNTKDKINKNDIEVVAYVVNTPIEICRERVEKRNLEENSHKVPLNILDRYWKSFQVPMLYEGFDEVVLHNTPIGYNKLDEELYEKMDNFYQNSSFHTYTLGTHSKKVLENIKKLTTDETLINGAYLHDVGKLYVGELRPNGWTRYIGHAETGAYLKLQHIDNLEEVWYENFHMLLMNNLSDKKISYYRKLFGERLWNNLVILREADTLAH